MTQQNNLGEEAMDLRFDLFDRLHKSMRVSGMTTATLGVALGVHRNTISNYLTGRTKMDRRTLISWAFATGVPLGWLENGETPAGPNGPDEGQTLPRLDSNQQPSGSRFAQVSDLFGGLELAA